MDKEHNSHPLGRRMFDLFKKEQLTDFKIVSSDNISVPCHRVVLAAMSPFLETMLTEDAGFKEHLSQSIQLPYSIETIQHLLSYMYTGDNYLDENTASLLYCLAHYLQIDDLSNKCKTFLEAKMDRASCLEVWQAARLFENNALAGIAKSYVLQNFNLFCKNREIGNIILDDFVELLNNQYLNTTVSHKCEAAWIWFISQELPDSDLCEKLITALIKAPNVENEDIKQACTVSLEEGDCFERIPELLQVWNNTCSNIIWGGDNKAPFVDSDFLEDECLIVLGGEQRSSQSQILAMNFKNKSWYSFPAGTETFGYKFAVCVVKGDIYISGGTQTPHHKHFLRYQTIEQTWLHLPTMPCGRENHAMVSIKGIIYVLGGATMGLGLQVDAFNLKKHKWSTHGEIALGVKNASTTVDGEIIYLFGGCTVGSQNVSMNRVQCYNTVTKYGWVLEPRLPFSCTMQSTPVVCVDGQLYVIYNGDVYIYYHNQEKGTVGRIENAPVRGHGALAFDDQILVFGGERDNFQQQKHLIQYDTKLNNSFTLPITTPNPIKNFAFTKGKLQLAALHGAKEL